jgi:hypothetical protein
LSKVTHEILSEGKDYNWEILAIKDTQTETRDLFVERKRVGSIIRPMYSFSHNMPLILVYFGGAKDGYYIRHSRIIKITTRDNEIKVYTKNTMYHLKLAVSNPDEESLNADSYYSELLKAKKDGTLNSFDTVSRPQLKILVTDEGVTDSQVADLFDVTPKHVEDQRVEWMLTDGFKGKEKFTDYNGEEL